ncbi:MAG: hypothetical protein IJZ34_05145 [Lachnospiraceae bacterium]|nr:hypothetical protein [Lachnospiraceae bacterium]
MILKSGNSKIIVGYDLGNKNSQISYYSAETSKVETASSVAGTQIYNIPTVLCKKYQVNQWLYGKEALRAAEQDEGILVDDLLQLALDGEPVQIEEEPYDPVALLTLFVKRSLSLLSMAGSIDRIGAFLISCEQMDGEMIDLLGRVLAGVGLKARHICFQSYEESFYQYMIHQPEELRLFQTVMFRFEMPVLKVSKMQSNGKTAPKAVMIEQEEYELPADMGEASFDAEFLEIAEKVCRNDRISAVYLVGEDFTQDIMKESLHYLCQGRRVFLGNNLYSQGACLGMMERLKASTVGRSHVLLGKDKLKANIGMRAVRKGEDSYFALLDAGTNWYEAVTECECYLRKEDSLELVIAPLNGKNGKIAQMSLDGMPPGIARIHLQLQMLDEERLEVTVEDLGFGEFRPASHQLWKEEMRLYD